MTEVNWAGSETLIGDIAEAERHLRNAQQIIDDLPPSSGKSVLQSQWNYARNQIESPQQKTAAFPSSIANPAALPSAPR